MSTKLQNNEAAPAQIKVVKDKEQEKIFIEKNPYSNTLNAGDYALLKVKAEKNHYSIMEWFDCRETTCNRYYSNISTPSVSSELLVISLFEKEKGTSDKIKSFMKIIEDKLDLKEENRITYPDSDHSNILVCKLSPWWTRPNYEVRYSLLTILLRAGLNYSSENSVEDISKLHPYLTCTKNALERFLSGYTRYAIKSDISKWRGTFVDDRNLNLLEKPKKFKKVKV